MLVTPDAAQRMLGVTSLDRLTPGAAGKTVTGTVAITEAPTPFPARNVIGILAAATQRYADSTSRSARTTTTSASRTGRSTTTPSRRRIGSSGRQGGQDPVRAATAEEQARITQLRDSLRVAHGGTRPDR